MLYKNREEDFTLLFYLKRRYNMAYWIQETDKNYTGRHTFVCEHTSDIANLPTNNPCNGKESCDFGSWCICVETGDVYILGKETGTWDRFGGNV